MRQEDAKVLMAHHRFHGALYLAGYAVECALKYAVTRKAGEVYLRGALETHRLDALLQHSGLKPSFDKTPSVMACYGVLADYWEPALRYQAPSLNSREARTPYNNVVQLYDWIIEQTE